MGKKQTPLGRERHQAKRKHKVAVKGRPKVVRQETREVFRNVDKSRRITATTAKKE